MTRLLGRWLAWFGLIVGGAIGCGGADTRARAMVAGDWPPGMAMANAARVIGVVVDGAGVPVANARVVFTPSSGGAAATLALPDAPVTLASDGQGLVHGTLRAGDYEVAIEASGGLRVVVDHVTWPADSLRFIAPRAVGIAGQVMDGTTPLPMANVVVVRDGAEELSVIADDEGRFVFGSLTQGTYRIYAYADDLVARSRLVELRQADQALQLTLAVEPGTVIAGAVRDRASGEGLAASVLLTAVGHDEPPRLVTTNRAGGFRFEGVARGRWQIAAASPGYLTSTPANVASTGALGAPLAIELEHGETLAIRVVEPGGAPVANASLWLREDDGNSIVGGDTGVFAVGGPLQLMPRAELGVTTGVVPLVPRTPLPRAQATAQAEPAVYVATQVTTHDVAAGGRGERRQMLLLPSHGMAGDLVTDAEGNAIARGLAAATWRITAWHPDYVQSDPTVVSLPLARGATGPVELKLRRGGRIAGRVVNAQGMGVPGVIVTWTAAGGPNRVPGVMGRTVADAGGSFAFAGVTGKGAVATTSEEGDASEMIEVAEGQLVSPTLVLAQQPGVVQGEVVDESGRGIGGAQVQLVEGNRVVVTDGNGRFLLRGVALGALTLRVSQRDYVAAQVQARGTAAGEVAARVRVVLNHGVRLELLVLDRHTGLAVPGATAALTRQAVVTRATSDGQGLVVFNAMEAGSWQLSLSVPGYVEIRRSLTLGGEAQRERVEFERGALISGVVRDRFGQRAAQAKVRAVRPADGVEVATLTNASGEFVLRNAPTGDIELTASVGGGRGGEARSLRPGDELTSVELTVR